jgi:para-nitrobenzyl esterase
VGISRVNGGGGPPRHESVDGIDGRQEALPHTTQRDCGAGFQPAQGDEERAIVTEGVKMKTRTHSCAIGLLLIAIHIQAADTSPIVEITQGRLLGVTENGVSSFKGISYAAPPVGNLRWVPPQAPNGWTGVRRADDFGNVCPQNLNPGYSLEVLRDRQMSEDCLYLNVWTPGLDPDTPHPVMVWILPGGFLQGDTAMPRYDGTALAHQGVVVVTFNYRLGMLGQFAHPALRRAQPEEPAGNYHMMDQVAALEWVRDNIAAFGGDPENVTIFGMSAGGVSVNYHMAMPVSEGLFHRAISESSGIRVGRPRHITEDFPGLPSLETEFIGVVEKLEISGDDEAVVKGLRDLTVEQILDFQANNMLGIGGSLNPVVDGGVVTRGVGEAFRNRLQHKVPYLTGATSWEGSLTWWATSSDLLLRVLHVSPDDALALYGEHDFKVVNNKLYVDFFFGSQRYFARHHATDGNPAFVYFFSRILDDHQEDLPGAAHGAEMRYVFRTLDSLTLLGEDIGDFGNRPNEIDERYSEMVSAYWVQFAKSGDPNGDGRPGWPALTPGNDLLLEFGRTGVTVHRDFREERRAFWEAHFDSGKL